MTPGASTGVCTPEVEMLLAMWGFLSGCVVPFDELECDSGLEAHDSGRRGCVSNDECGGAYACGDWSDRRLDERTDADGCFERCVYDVECKGGYRCDGYGACIAGP